MIEEHQPKSITFMLYGAHEGKSKTINKKHHFVEGKLQVPKEDAVLLERTFRFYSACSEIDFPVMQKQYEDAQGITQQAQIEADAEAEVKAEAEARVKAEMEADAEAKVKADAKEKAEAKAKAEAEAKEKPKVDEKPKVEAKKA